MDLLDELRRLAWTWLVDEPQNRLDRALQKLRKVLGDNAGNNFRMLELVIHNRIARGPITRTQESYWVEQINALVSRTDVTAEHLAHLTTQIERDIP